MTTPLPETRRWPAGGPAEVPSVFDRGWSYLTRCGLNVEWGGRYRPSPVTGFLGCIAVAAVNRFALPFSLPLLFRRQLTFRLWPRIVALGITPTLTFAGLSCLTLHSTRRCAAARPALSPPSPETGLAADPSIRGAL